MRIKPATPLAIAYFISFAFLLISTISAPIIPSIPIASWDNTNYGVFGYCNDTYCSPVTVNYNTSTRSNSNQSLHLSANTRNDLSAILIVHPIAAFLNLVCFAMAFACHFRPASHSSKYLMALLILSFPTLLITLLAFLVDILVFIPDQAVGCWIVLGSTVLVMLCSIFTCAMRRTLVSRKARKKRIDQDEHMNGANAEDPFQSSSQPQLVKDPAVARDSQYVRADSPPPLDGSHKSDKGLQFATFESERSRPSTDDRTPLNQSVPGRDPSIRTTSTTAGRSQRSATDPNRPPPFNANGDPYAGTGRVSPVSPMEYETIAHQQRHLNGSQRGRGGPPPGYGRGRGGFPPSRGAGYPRGAPRGGPRGGYRGMPPPRGGGPGSRGPPPPNGGWYGAAAGGAVGGAAAGAMMMNDRYQQRGPPRYQDDYARQDPYAQQSAYDYYPPNGLGQRDAYGQQPQAYAQQPRAYEQQPQTYEQQPQAYAQQPRAYEQQPQTYEQQPQAHEQQPAYESAYGPGYGPEQSTYPSQHNYQQPSYQPQPTPPPQPQAAPAPPQPSFNDEAVVYRGPVGARRTPTASPAIQSPASETSRDPTSIGFSGRRPSPGNAASEPRNPPYSAEAMPPMAQEPMPVGQAIEMDATSGSPMAGPGQGLAIGAALDGAEDRSPRQANRGAAELGSESSPHKRKGSPHANLMLGGLHSHPVMGSDAHPVEIDSAPRESVIPRSQSASRSQSRDGRPRAASDAYYEDVDPRFAQDESVQGYQQGHAAAQPSSTVVPSNFRAPAMTNSAVTRDYSASSFYSASSTDPVSRVRSPGAASDMSNFTSVSQRGVNPAWQPGPGSVHGGFAGGYGPSRPRVDDQMLTSNPDFALQKGTHGHVRGGSAGGSHQYPVV